MCSHISYWHQWSTIYIAEKMKYAHTFYATVINIHRITMWCYYGIQRLYYTDVIMGTIASQITSLTIVFSNVYSDADQRKHQSSASLAFVRGIHREPVNPSHKWPVTRKMFPFPSSCNGNQWHIIEMLTLVISSQSSNIWGQYITDSKCIWLRDTPIT